MENENESKDSSAKSSSTNREFSVYAKSGSFNPSTSLLTSNKERKSSSPLNTNHGPSFTQRLIERGVAVPSSFSTLEKTRPSEDSSSPGSYDFDTYYGMSPFITPSFSANDPSHFHHDGPLYKSLRHRYEKEKNNLKDCIDEEEIALSSPEFLSNNNNSPHRKKYLSHQPKLPTHKEKPNAEDSDIELSDDEEEEVTMHDSPKHKMLSPHNSRARRSRSPLSFPPSSDSTESLKLNNYHQGLYDELLGRNKIKAEEEKTKLSPSTERLKNLLITPPKKKVETNLPIRQPKPLSSPPRKHLLHTPVFQVVNANTVKDRYLFLFNDLLLICKPIMDENIIVGSKSSAGKERYRFRSNENSLFQVKNIVELAKLTLYISKDDYYYASNTKPSTVEIGSDGKPILPPARKIHPVMATALRKFESNAATGIRYLIDKGALTNDSLNIANFLFKTPDLNRRQLGYYLADQKNADVYDAFLECFRLVGLRLDEALRILLTTFRLPSLWEALEYIIERFAKKWHDANQNVVKFHEDMVVKVVVATLFLNAELWFEATSEKDVFWYAREVKERQGRQSKRKMSMIDYQRLHQSMGNNKPSLLNTNRQSVTIEPLHYIVSLRAKGSSQPTLSEFLERWNYYDQYHLVPHEFMEEMFKSIQQERLETGWDNKAEEVSDSPQDVVITVVPHRLPSRLTKGVASDPITISIPAPDKGLQIKLRGQDLVFKPNVLDFTHSCVQSFTITGNTHGRTSLMFIKSGENAGNYVSPTLPRTKTVVIERPFMRYTFQIGFKHLDKKLVEDTLDKEDDTEPKNDAKGDEERKQKGMVNRLYTFSVETLEERTEWLEALKKLSGFINGVKNEYAYSGDCISSESKVALQVLKEVLLADEIKKGTARTKNRHTMHSMSLSAATSPISDTSASILNDNEVIKEDDIPSNMDDRHGRVMKLLLPKTIDRSSTLSTTANVVTKRGHEIIQLVVQNSMVPLVLSFLRNCTKDK